MTAVPEQYSLLLQVLSSVFKNPELSLTIIAISFCRIAVCHHKTSTHLLEDCLSY